LPEFRKIRLQNQNFINLCMNSNLSSEITLQPINRFNLDSAIIFSDILVVPYALGQKVNFIKDQGPKLEGFSNKTFLENNKNSFTKKLQPVYDAIKKCREKLHKDKSLIGFIGAPWTLLIYMLGIKQNKNELDYNKIKERNYPYLKLTGKYKKGMYIGNLEEVKKNVNHFGEIDKCILLCITCHHKVHDIK